MQTDIWYDLTLRELSGEDAVAERLRDAETAQPLRPADEPDADDQPAAEASREATDEPGGESSSTALTTARHDPCPRAAG